MACSIGHSRGWGSLAVTSKGGSGCVACPARGRRTYALIMTQVSDGSQRHAENCRNLPVKPILYLMTRGEAATGIAVGLILAVGGFLLGNVISFGGVTFAAFNFGIVIGAAMVVYGLVGLVRGE